MPYCGLGARSCRIRIGNMTAINPAEFMRQVRQEVARVTWPTRKETLVTTAMVFVMVFIAAGFFFAIDQLFGWLVPLIEGVGR
jgi:preprotein translocase subunit SecE